MSQKDHKRSRLPNKAVAVLAALVLGSGGAAFIAANASAGNATPDAGQTQSVTGAGTGAATIACPDVGDQLQTVPEEAKPAVDQNLAQLDAQVADSYKQMASGQSDSASLLSNLQQERSGTITRISDAIAQVSEPPAGLDALSTCQMKPADSAGAQSDPNAAQNQQSQQNVQNGQVAQNGQGTPNSPNSQNSQSAQAPQAQSQGKGPSRADFVDITKVRPNVKAPRAGAGASTGTFASKCGRNENGHLNPDNVIVAPGVSNGAHHMHDYVGNKTTDAFSTNDSLAAAGTTCSNGDQSAYYWPVLRVQNGGQENDANAPGGGQDANVGKILQPKNVTIQLNGSPVGKVTAMPRFLRIITGDAKGFTNGTANTNASWSCTGFENRQLKDKYPICPQGSDVVRTFTFQSCWDGKNIDSANHRTHVAFADANGACGQGFKAIPQLVERITYSVPKGARIAVDSFPEQLHKPVTDHGDFIDAMSDSLMKKAVNCINGGRKCA
ncbi:DUF1996 domain-containing protein [Streptomyces sp. H10-C2]|uniref:DUF1996 domain-containing protein n=1 Tax=unclassified Streptomyces TaxID=2593676 RepID=UPI0024B9B86E|nr:MULTISPECIES: DUF1996 domain-containing protein [unclassified Streptomyces]MDJ0340954.1 DUF1996 domain-containing protein [Streptomyces sp. PH10-H1]MDJ0369814.1 DUF1996 domain-containing protein [Streptomyces sp. H10-C2]